MAGHCTFDHEKREAKRESCHEKTEQIGAGRSFIGYRDGRRFGTGAGTARRRHKTKR